MATLTQKLAESERMVELMKSSNRELNAKIVSPILVALVDTVSHPLGAVC